MNIDAVLASFASIFQKVTLPILNFMLALIVLFITLLIARLLKNLVLMILKAIQLDSLLKEVKFNSILEKADIKKTSSELLSEMVYWLAVFWVVLALIASLGLPVEPALDRLSSFIGIVFVATLTLALGSFLAAFIGNLVYIVCANIGLSGAKTIAKIIQYATVIFSFLLALEQLGIGPALLQPSLGVIIGAVGLGAAIAFGLGCKDIMADFVSNLIRGK